MAEISIQVYGKSSDNFQREKSDLKALKKACLKVFKKALKVNFLKQIFKRNQADKPWGKISVKWTYRKSWKREILKWN